LLPPDLRQWLRDDHLAFYVSDIVEQLDLSAIVRAYEEGRGRPPYHPQMMVKLLIYGYCVGKLSARKIEQATYDDVAFRVLSGNQQPDHASIAESRKRHLEELAKLFVQVLQLCKRAGAQNDSNDDGLLEAREVMQLDLQADLVVLSACQTARGRIGAGEGMVGMSWAFFVAGVPTMVASQWKVDSASTAKLMVDFHKRLKEQSAQSETKASALQQASLNLMKDSRYRHPYFWAGFVMIGRN
jgi:transposase